MVIFHGGAVKDGFLIEAAYPVSYPIENGEIHSRMLEATPALTMLITATTKPSARLC
jgi:hypothetical protein